MNITATRHVLCLAISLMSACADLDSPSDFLNADTDGDTDADVDSDSESDTVTDTDSDSETDSESETDSGFETDSDTASGSDTDSETETHSDSDSETSELELSLFAPGKVKIPFGGEFDFADVKIRGHREARFTIENTGKTDVDITGIHLSGTDENEFEIDTTGMPSTILQDGQASFKVVFSPTLGGTLTSGVRIASDKNGFDFDVVGRVVEFHGIATLELMRDVGKYTSVWAKDDVVHLCYYNETTRTLCYQRSTNGGIDWIQREITSKDGETGRGSAIAVDGDEVFISTTVGSKVGLARSTDNGDTWDASAITIKGWSTHNNGPDDYATSIALDGSNVFIGFHRGSDALLGVVKAPYSGGSWVGKQFYGGGSDETGYYSSMQVAGEVLHVSHTGYMTSDLYSSKIALDLSSHDTRIVDNTGTMGNDGYTSIAVVGKTVYIAYFDERPGTHDLKFAKSINIGELYTSSTIDETSGVIGKFPSMAAASNDVFVSYFDETNNHLKIALSDDCGTHWSMGVVDPTADAVGKYSSLAADGKNIYITYYDETNKNLKLAKSLDRGETWN